MNFRNLFCVNCDGYFENSTILFECGIKDKIYMFHIDGCTNFEVLFS